MKLEQYIALHLALIVCLSSLMLGLGQGDVILPIITLIGAGISLRVVDFKKLFSVGPVLSNVLIVVILLLSAGYLIRAFDASLGGSLFAVAILRVLVFFQLVLLFRKKENRTCWNIMMVSFLEVIVASVFQQTVIFGLMMILYLFVSLTVVTLMHLNRDRRYFTEHVFLRSLFRASRKELLSRKGLADMARRTLASMFSGPLALIARFRGRAPRPEPAESAPPDMSGIWEESLSQALAANDRRHRKPSYAPGRWPLAYERAAFSSSATDRSGLIGIGREFYFRLVVGTVASLVVGLLFFFLTPRQGFFFKNLEMQQENWRTPAPAQGFHNTVGFSEEIRLGSLGTVLDNPAEVMAVSFVQLTDPPRANETDYTAIRGQSVYFRGVPLIKYSGGRWSGERASYLRPQGPPPPNHFFGFGFPPEYGHVEQVERFRDHVDFPMDNVVHRERASGAISPVENWQGFQFQPGSQLVSVRCDYVYPSQQTLFSVWPYFISSRQDMAHIVVRPDRIVNESSQNDSQRRDLQFNFQTYAFLHGTQADLIPCQESVDSRFLLAFDDSALTVLGETALRWDEEFRDRGTIERARNLERHFLTDERYYYALGGITRNSSLDPLEDFVRDHPGGHCEYFAGALAMMLRKIGLPSRVIVGYRMDAEIAMQSGNRYIVRQSDAHSWVEVYVPPQEIPDSLREGPYADWWQRGGWLRLDPTAPRRDIMTQSGFWADMKYKATGFWNDYIINFNAARQESAIYSPIAEFATSMKERFFDAEYWKTIGRAVTQRYAEIFRQLRQGNWQGNDLLLLCLPIVLILVICYCIYRLARLLIREMHGFNLARAKRQRLVTVEFYLRFEKILQRIGLTRRPAETQREFAVRASADLVTMLNLANFVDRKNATSDAMPTAARSDDIDRLPRQLVEAFYRVRYGHAVLTPPETEEVNAILLRLENAAATCRQAS